MKAKQISGAQLCRISMWRRVSTWKFRFAVIGIVFSILYLVSGKIAEAQTLSLSIWPPILEVTLKPGKSISQVYRVKNSGDDTVVMAQVVPFEAAGELGQVKLSSTPNPALAYFSLQNADLDLGQSLDRKST